MSNQITSFKSLSEVPEIKWEELSSKKLFFGHQSVGYNILDGIKDKIKEYPHIKLDIIESTDFERHSSGAIFHSRIGRNTEPSSKMADFERILTSKDSVQIDLAFLKLCYVDIKGNSDSEQIFANYENMIKRIKLKNTKTKIIHFTAPLTTIQRGIKALLKKILGKPLYGCVENANRDKYNQLLRSLFSTAEPIFDLSKFESTRSDGSRETAKLNGKEFFLLAPEYSNDGGHLNVYGRKIIAEKLLLFLINQL